MELLKSHEKGGPVRLEDCEGRLLTTRIRRLERYLSDLWAAGKSTAEVEETAARVLQKIVDHHTVRQEERPSEALPCGEWGC